MQYFIQSSVGGPAATETLASVATAPRGSGDLQISPSPSNITEPES